MASYGDGKWHAATLGQFIGQLVDEADTAVIFRQVSVTPHGDNKESTQWQVYLVAEGHMSSYLARCESVHKTLCALMDAGLVT